MGLGMLRPPVQRPVVELGAMFNPGTDAYEDMSDMFGVAVQLADSTPLFDAASVVDTGDADTFVCILDLEMDPRLFDDGLTSGDDEVFVALVEVPRDFFVGGSSREAFIEFKLPCEGLLLFSDLERLLDPLDWLDGVGELFTGTLRRSPIVPLAIILGCIWDGRFP